MQQQPKVNKQSIYQSDERKPGRRVCSKRSEIRPEPYTMATIRIPRWAGIGVGLLTVLLLLGVEAQVPGFGKCPKVPVVENFDTYAYLGRWYEQEKYPFFFELGGKCITADYSLNPDGTIGVLNTQKNSITGNENSIVGSARIVQSARLAVRFPSAPFNVEAPYWVVGTDYKTFAVVYACSDLRGFINAKVAWILTRKRHPDIETMKKAYAVLDSAKISRAYLTRTDQKNCGEELVKVSKGVYKTVVKG
uniref:Apolipoprotein D n=2 Tax=Anopheles merus TaxID=30066 RepID=A0A182UP05_ANOME